MGEHADMLVDRMWDEMDSDMEEEEGPFPITKRCRYCGKGGLMWQTTEKGWRLADDKGIHVCSAFKAKK